MNNKRACLQCEIVKDEKDFPNIKIKGLQGSLLCEECIRINSHPRQCDTCKRPFVSRDGKCKKCLELIGFKVCLSCDVKKTLHCFYKKRLECKECISNRPRAKKIEFIENPNLELKCIKCKTINKMINMYSKRICKTCFLFKVNTETQKEYLERVRIANLSQNDRRIDYQLRVSYGITIEEYRNMVKDQGGVCFICNKSAKRRLNVDHCHETGRVRALLCENCNLGLGNFKESADFLKSAIAYIERFNKKC